MQGEGGMTALHIACFTEDIELVEAVLESIAPAAQAAAVGQLEDLLHMSPFSIAVGTANDPGCTIARRCAAVCTQCARRAC